MALRAELRDIGCFEEAEVELRPLTLLVGVNSVGKSLLLYLLWVLASTPPEFEVLGRRVGEAGLKLARLVLDSVGRGWEPVDEMRRLISMYVGALPEALSVSLWRGFERSFGADVSRLVRLGASNGVVRVRGEGLTLELRIARGVEASLDGPAEKLLESFSIEVPQPGVLRVMYGGELVSEERVETPIDVLRVAVEALVYLLGRVFGGYVGDVVWTPLLVDGRAGLARSLLRPYLDPEVARHMLHPDEQYIRLYFRVAEHLAEGGIEVELIKPLLRELGVEVYPVLEGGAYTIRVRAWSGFETRFEQTPSGVRESLILALTLAAKQPGIVFAEEPEAHLHPRAQRLLARLIAASINRLGKRLVVTTHSDYLIYALSNLITLSACREAANRLGYADYELLEPSQVAVYLVRRSGSTATLERLRVDEEGIPTEEFELVARELVDERAAALEAREACGG